MNEVAALILAAGRGARFNAGRESKVIAMFDGKPLVRRVAETALSSKVASVTVVVGHAEMSVCDMVEDLDLVIARNPDHASGMASSLRAGLVQVPPSCAGALILLADMPFVQAQTLDALIECFSDHPTADAIVPTYEGRQGNPVLLSRRLFGDVAELDGDKGARVLLGQTGRCVIERPVPDVGILRDIDTRDALAAVNGERKNAL